MNVGTGSNEQHFTGDVIIIRRISAGVHGQSDDSDDSAWLTAGVGDTSAVEARMSSTFRAKKCRKAISSLANSTGHIAVSAEQRWEWTPQSIWWASVVTYTLKPVLFFLDAVCLMLTTCGVDPRSTVFSRRTCSGTQPEAAAVSRRELLKPRAKPP